MTSTALAALQTKGPLTWLRGDSIIIIDTIIRVYQSVSLLLFNSDWLLQLYAILQNRTLLGAVMQTCRVLLFQKGRALRFR